MKYFKTDNWSPAPPMMIILSVLAVTTGSEIFLIGAVVPFAFLLYSSLYRIPENSLEITREVKPATALPDDDVKVELSVKNTSNLKLRDIRIVDGVPDSLAVKSGSPRISTSLDPGEKKTAKYSLTAKRGKYKFKPVKIKTKNINSSLEAQESLEASGDSRIICRAGLDSFPLQDNFSGSFGQIETSEGGSGMEFHSLRDYRSSDPLKQVEWRRFAKTGELATVNFRDENSSEVMIILDSRKISDVKKSEGSPSARDLCFYAGKRIFDILDDSGHKVGLTGLGMEYNDFLETNTESGVPVVRTSEKNRNKVREFFSTHENEALKGETGDFYAEEIYRFAPPGCQIVIISPILDKEIEPLTRTLSSHGNSVTLVSPDITSGNSSGAEVESFERDLRMAELKKNAEVIDWGVSSSLSVAVSETLSRIKKNLGETY